MITPQKYTSPIVKNDKYINNKKYNNYKYKHTLDRRIYSVEELENLYANKF